MITAVVYWTGKEAAMGLLIFLAILAPVCIVLGFIFDTEE